MSVGDTPIEIDLKTHHKTLITGTNGTGKSTMLEAITYALFGKSFRDIKIGQLVNSVTKKNLLVELVMEYDLNVYKITRGQKPAVFKIEKNGDEIEATTTFQNDFEEMIGMNYNSFKQVVVLGTAGYKPFMELSKPDRRKLVEDLLEVSVLAEMDKSNKSIIKQINVVIQQIDVNIQHTQQQIKTHEEYKARQLALSGDNLKRLQSMHDESMAKIDQIKIDFAKLTKQLNELILPPDLSAEITEKHRHVVETEGKVNSFKRVLDLYNRGGTCPTCLQQLVNDSLTSKIKENVELDTRIFDQLKAELLELTTKRSENAKVSTEIQSLNGQIDILKANAKSEAERIGKLRTAIAEAEKEVIDNSDVINECKTKLSEFVDQKQKLVTEKHQRSYIVDMLKDGGVKGSIIKQYLPLFNKQINHYLSIMEADYSFTLNEEFVETIKSRGRESFSYSSFSQGEKARIDLAMLFTWRDVAEQISGIKINCLFLDEVADGSTDAQGVKTIQQILNSKSDANIFIISHRDHNPQDYGQHVQMKKVGRFTVREK